MTTPEYLPIRPAADALGCSHASIYNLITDGKLKSVYRENGSRMVKMIKVSDAKGLVRDTRGRPPLQREQVSSE